MTLSYVGTQENITITLDQINQNLNLPFGNTISWDIPKKAYQQDFWFIFSPPQEGWTREDGTHFMQEQMISGVINVEIQESQPDWFSTYPPKD